MSDEIAICPSCGGRFNPVCGNHRRTYCFYGCQSRASAYKYDHGTLDGLKVKVIVGSAAWKALNDPHVACANRLARRDAEYAKLGTRVVVDCVKTTDGRTLVVETRGQRCIGWRSCGHVSHN